MVTINISKGEIYMEVSYEELLAENAALKECVKTQAKTIERLLDAYVLTVESEEDTK